MITFPPAMKKLVQELSKLPSVGEKSAVRFAYYLLNSDRSLGNSLADAIREAVTKVRLCEQCFFLTDSARCSICSDTSRDATQICVVEKPMDLVAIERVGEYHGYYHVLHGLWAPLRGQGPESMKGAELVERMKGGVIKEVILATSSTVEGDATALYLVRLLAEYKVRTSRLAQGMPKGGELEYADDMTLSHAFSGRSVINS